jgi:hypothetical protein
VDYTSRSAEKGNVDPEKIGGFDRSSVKVENADIGTKA